MHSFLTESIWVVQRDFWNKVNSTKIHTNMLTSIWGQGHTGGQGCFLGKHLYRYIITCLYFRCTNRKNATELLRTFTITLGHICVEIKFMHGVKVTQHMLRLRPYGWRSLDTMSIFKHGQAILLASSINFCCAFSSLEHFNFRGTLQFS